MPDNVDSVNKIVVYFTLAKKSFEERDLKPRAIEMARYEADLRAFVRDYERLEELTRPIPTVDGTELSDLPKELLAELSITKTDELEDQLVTIIKAAGGSADIDTILIYLFRRFKVVQTRRYLQNKLWRMVQKEMLHSIEGKKGVYSVQPAPPDEELQEGAKADKLAADSLADAIRNPDAFDPDDEIPF